MRAESRTMRAETVAMAEAPVRVALEAVWGATSPACPRVAVDDALSAEAADINRSDKAVMRKK